MEECEKHKRALDVSLKKYDELYDLVKAEKYPQARKKADWECGYCIEYGDIGGWRISCELYCPMARLKSSSYIDKGRSCYSIKTYRTVVSRVKILYYARGEEKWEKGRKVYIEYEPKVLGLEKEKKLCLTAIRRLQKLLKKHYERECGQ